MPRVWPVRAAASTRNFTSVQAPGDGTSFLTRPQVPDLGPEAQVLIGQQNIILIITPVLPRRRIFSIFAVRIALRGLAQFFQQRAVGSRGEAEGVTARFKRMI